MADLKLLAVYGFFAHNNGVNLIETLLRILFCPPRKISCFVKQIESP